MLPTRWRAWFLDTAVGSNRILGESSQAPIRSKFRLLKSVQRPFFVTSRISFFGLLHQRRRAISDSPLFSAGPAPAFPQTKKGAEDPSSAPNGGTFTGIGRRALVLWGNLVLEQEVIGCAFRCPHLQKYALLEVALVDG